VLARRLLAFVAVLMGLTLIAAILAPAPRQTAPPATATPAEKTVAQTAVITLDTADGQREAEVEEGDDVVLTVDSDTLGTLQINGLGLIEAVAPDSPAQFDFLADSVGDYPVVTDGGDKVATIRVIPPAP
jgi:hypothetical protein